MAARHDVHTGGWERRREQLLAAPEAVFAPEAQVHRQGSGPKRADELPDATVFILGVVPGRSPSFDALGALDLTGDEVTAEIRRQEAQAREFLLVPPRTAERDICTEGDATEP